eukprot:4947746-Pleurochrysis_carterae.AAC.1
MANSEAVWRAHLSALADEHPFLQSHFGKVLASVATGASARVSYQQACSALPCWQREQAVASWKAKDYS